MEIRFLAVNRHTEQRRIYIIYVICMIKNKLARIACLPFSFGGCAKEQIYKSGYLGVVQVFQDQIKFVNRVLLGFPFTASR